MKQRVRVAMIIHGYPPRLGGAERQLAALGPHLLASGVEVQVLTRRFPGLRPCEVREGIPVYRLPAPGPKAVASLAFTAFSLVRLVRLRPQVIHAHELFSATTTALVARRLWGIPVVVTAHRSGPLGDVYRLQRKWLGVLRIASIRRNVDRFVVISRDIQRELRQIGVDDERMVFVPNGVDTDRFGPVGPNERQSIRRRLGLPEGKIAIFSGRLEPEKRVDQLIAIWPQVREVEPSATLLVLGGGSQAINLQERAGEGVVFLGQVEDVCRYLQAADIFVLPSVAEGLSVAMLEALATGLPLIVTQVGGATDVIEHGKNGWLIPPEDPQALFIALKYLFGDVTLRRELGRQGRKTVEQEYALPRLAQKLQQMYCELAENCE